MSYLLEKLAEETFSDDEKAVAQVLAQIEAERKDKENRLLKATGIGARAIIGIGALTSGSKLLSKYLENKNNQKVQTNIPLSGIKTKGPFTDPGNNFPGSKNINWKVKPKGII